MRSLTEGVSYFYFYIAYSHFPIAFFKTPSVSLRSTPHLQAWGG